jgi:hypothetical protein
LALARWSALEPRGTLPDSVVSKKMKEFLTGFPPPEGALDRTSTFGLILCFASTASLAQIAVRDHSLVPLETNCPIGIRATVEKNGDLLAAQNLQVTLTKWPSFGVVASRITVHGIAAGANGPEQSEIQVSLDLNRILDPRLIGSPGSQPVWQPYPTGDLQGILPPLAAPVIIKSSTPHSPDSRWYAWVRGFTAVNFIELESVSYADGTSWQVSNGKVCRVSVSSSGW